MKMILRRQQRNHYGSMYRKDSLVFSQHSISSHLCSSSDSGSKRSLNRWRLNSSVIEHHYYLMNPDLINEA